MTRPTKAWSQAILRWRRESVLLPVCCKVTKKKTYLDRKKLLRWKKATSETYNFRSLCILPDADIKTKDPWIKWHLLNLFLKSCNSKPPRNFWRVIWLLCKQGQMGAEERVVCFFLPVLPQGHQEPDELAAHSPSFWHLDQLLFALASAQHPTDSRDTAGWQPHGVQCCHCKPGEDKVTPWRKGRGVILRTLVVPHMCTSKIISAFQKNHCTFALTKERQLGSSKKRRMSSRFASSAAKCKAERPLLRSYQKRNC